MPTAVIPYCLVLIPKGTLSCRQQIRNLKQTNITYTISWEKQEYDDIVFGIPTCVRYVQHTIQSRSKDWALGFAEVIKEYPHLETSRLVVDSSKPSAILKL